MKLEKLMFGTYLTERAPFEVWLSTTSISFPQQMDDTKMSKYLPKGGNQVLLVQWQYICITRRGRRFDSCTEHFFSRFLFFATYVSVFEEHVAGKEFIEYTLNRDCFLFYHQIKLAVHLSGKLLSFVENRHILCSFPDLSNSCVR